MAWLRRQMEDDSLLHGGGVWRFALRLTIKTIVAANLAVTLLHVLLDGLGWLPFPLGPALTVALLNATVVTALVSLTVLMVIGQAIQKLVRSRDDFERLSVTDPLTGLSNRRAFMARLEAAPSASLLVLLDIDRFKRVNDTYGHPVGDEVICATAAVLAAAAPPGLPAGRLGGEEFGLLLPGGMAPEAALAQVEALRQAVAALRFAGMPGGITISAGVAEVMPGLPRREVMIAADLALYRAKRGGRDRVVAAWNAPLRRRCAA